MPTTTNNGMLSGSSNVRMTNPDIRNIAGDMISNTHNDNRTEGHNFNEPTNYRNHRDSYSGTYNGGNFGGGGVGGDGRQESRSGDAERPRGGFATPQTLSSALSSSATSSTSSSSDGYFALHPDEVLVTDGSDLASIENPMDLVFKMSEIITRMHDEYSAKVEELNQLKRDHDVKLANLRLAFDKIIHGLLGTSR